MIFNLINHLKYIINNLIIKYNNKNVKLKIIIKLFLKINKSKHKNKKYNNKIIYNKN